MFIVFFWHQEIAAIDRERAAMRQRHARAAHDQARWGLTCRMMAVTVAVYILAHQSREIAEAYATRARMRRRRSLPSYVSSTRGRVVLGHVH